MLLPSLSYNSGVGWGAQEDFWRVEFTQGGVLWPGLAPLEGALLACSVPLASCPGV